MISARRKLVKPDVNTDDAPVGEDVRRTPLAGCSRQRQPLSRLGPSIVHLLQTEGAHVIFIDRRRRPGNADGRPACPDHP